MGAVAVGALLTALLLVIVAAMLWQQARRRPSGEPVTFVVEDAARFIHEGLRAPTRRRLTTSDVRRILEWDLDHARAAASQKGGSILGDGESIEYVLEAGAAAGLDFDPIDIGEVIAAEGKYLAAIGAIGERVEEETT